MPRFWPLESGRIITSRYGPRAGGFHAGLDLGFPGGSGGRLVYAPDDGSVIYHGAAEGYGSPDPHGWLVIESPGPNAVWELGHITRMPHIATGSKVAAGQPIATINGDRRSNGNVDAHLHVSLMFNGYRPNRKIDPLPYLLGASDPMKEKPAAMTTRPDFNEYAVWSRNHQPRNGIKPTLFILHTQEGTGNADSLARWMQGPVGVSYHYTVSQDPRDHGVTVCDVVDTDRASWSVLSANNRSINLCFAGSSVNWSREQWMLQSRAIDVAAYLAVQDCRKYSIPIAVIAPPYSANRAGITDHAFVTRVLGDGTHTDCGPNFPWSYFAERVAHWANPTPAPPPPPPPTPAHPITLEDIKAQLDRIEKLVAGR